MSKEELLKPRYKVIADYPNSPYKIGHIIKESDNLEGALFFKTEVHKYPHLFKPLGWYQERLLDDMVSVKFIRVVIYEGYWVVGDVVPVENYQFHDGKFVCYILKHKHIAHPNKCEPATEQEYLEFKKQEKGFKVS